MQADVLLLAAGFGKRLQAVSDGLPKPLVPFCGKPLIEWNLELIARSGFKRVFVNLHYRGEQILDFVGDGSSWGLEVICVNENPILETGGAIANIRSQIKTPQLITLNSDAIFDPKFSLRTVLEHHLAQKSVPAATLVVRRDPQAKEYGALGVSADRRVVRFLDVPYGAGPVVDEVMYTGVQVIERDLIGMMPSAGTIFSITRDFYPEFLKNGGNVGTYLYEGFFSDIGTPERLSEASKDYQLILRQ